MANIFAHSIALQPTSAAMLTTGADIFTNSGVRQSTPTSATIITTPPTFAGITSAAAHTNGSFLISWPSATSPNAPIEFQIYAAVGTVSPAALFVNSNLVGIGKPNSTQMRVWMLGDQSTYFVNGLTYTFGVRAKDGVQNQNANLVVIQSTAIGSGNLTTVLQTLAVDLAALEDDLNNDLILSNAAVTGTQDVLSSTQYQLSFLQSQIVLMNTIIANLNTLVSNVSGIQEDLDINLNTVVYQTSVLSGIINDSNVNLSGSNLALAQSTANLSTINSQIVAMNSTINEIDNVLNSVSGIESALASDLSVLISGLADLSDNINDSIYNLLLSNQNLSGTNLALQLSNWNLQSTSGTLSGAQVLADTLQQSIIYIGGVADSVENSSDLLDTALQNVQTDVVGTFGVTGLFGIVEKPEELNN